MKHAMRWIAVGRWVWYAAAVTYLLALVSTLPVSMASPALATLPLVIATALTWPIAFAGRWRAGTVVASVVILQAVIALTLLREPSLPDQVLAPAWLVAFLTPVGVLIYVLRMLRSGRGTCAPSTGGTV